MRAHGASLLFCLHVLEFAFYTLCNAGGPRHGVTDCPLRCVTSCRRAEHVHGIVIISTYAAPAASYTGCKRIIN